MQVPEPGRLASVGELLHVELQRKLHVVMSLVGLASGKSCSLNMKAKAFRQFPKAELLYQIVSRIYSLN